jgi:predicted nucleic acid-binding protein
VVADAQRLCFDTNALIYLLEGVPPYHSWLDRLLLDMEQKDRAVVLSVVTEAEIMVRPLRDDATGKIARIQATTDAPNVSVVATSRQIAREAAAVRAAIDIKLPDAIIVATAIISGCDALIGNDKTCARRVTQIPYIYLDEVVKT